MSDPEILPPIDTQIAEYSQTAAALAELRQQIEGHTFDCTTTKGDQEARQTRLQLVRLRTALEAKRKELKAPLLDQASLIDAEAKRITGAIVELELPIDAAIKAEEQRKAAEKAEAERLERERLAAIQARIDSIRNMPLELVSAPAVMVAAAIATMTAERGDLLEGLEGPHLEDAEAAHAHAIDKLERIHAAAIENERLAAELRAQREEQAAALRAAEAELESRRAAAQAARDEADRIAAEQRAAADAAAQAERDRLAAELAEQQRQVEEQAARQRAAEEAAERERQAQAAAAAAEQARIAEEARRAEEAAQAEAEERRIQTATLLDAAAAAVDLLVELGHAGALQTRALAAAIERHAAKRSKRATQP